MTHQDQSESLITKKLYLSDAYCTEMDATIVSHVGEHGVVLDETIFFAAGGGQPGDRGSITWDGTQFQVDTAEDGSDGAVILQLSSLGMRPPVGAKITQTLDWNIRYNHMRLHTALHLLTVALPFPVTGGQISAEKGRLDFCMPTAIEDKAGLEARLNGFVSDDLPVSIEWISVQELAENPGLVKTQQVQPPSQGGRVRLIRIGSSELLVDRQPCGGTHVARTGEIGQIVLGKVENKGKNNRRVSISVF